MSDLQKHTVLEVKTLSIGYGKNSIATDINFNLNSGELVGLIGINGAGKSTLLRTLSGLQESLSGEIMLMQKQIETYSSQEQAQLVSVVLTKQPISKNVSVEELVTLGRQPYTNWLGSLSAIDLSIVNEALEATGIHQLKNKKCYELSDGQLQRVLIARALAQDTNIIFLDEPLAHLDLHHKASILKLLKEIAYKKGKAILFSTHDIEHAIPLCDKMMVFRNENIKIGTPQELSAAGVFDTLFPSSHIQFDRKSGRFSIDN